MVWTFASIAGGFARKFGFNFGNYRSFAQNRCVDEAIGEIVLLSG